MKTLRELQDEHLPRASCDVLAITPKGDPTKVEHATRIMDNYFQHFLAPVMGDEAKEFMSSHPCIRCSRPQSGMLGAFTWGICHGEGYCGNCKYPARTFHQIPENDGDDEPFATLNNYILQYHPSVLSEDTEQMNAEGQVCCVG